VPHFQFAGVKGLKIEMAHLERIRWLLHVEGKSQRQVAKALGISRKTVAKYAQLTEVPRYQRRKPVEPVVMTPEFQAEIERRLAENDTLPRKQRWTGRTIYEDLDALGYQGSEPTVRRYIAKIRKLKRMQPTFIPLAHDPGESIEVDWGEAVVVLAGAEVTVQILCVRLRWSGMPVVIAYPSQRQEALFDGIRRALELLGGVPRRMTLDNLRQAVKRILEGRNREEQDAFLRFRTYYLIDSNFCNPASGHEKGSVENLVGLAQRYILGPRREARTWDELNTILWQRCLEYARRVPQGSTQSILERWEQEKKYLRPLPARPFDCCKVALVTSNKVSCVTFETCRYSVPVQYANRSLQVRAYWDRIDIYAGQEKIARHPRCYERNREILDLDHYLDLLHAKPGALAQAKPFRMAQLPAVYHQFRAEMQAQGRSDREFIEILMLHRTYSVSEVSTALERALAQRTTCYTAVKQLLSAQPAPADGALYAAVGELASIRVQQPSLAEYNRLLKGGVVH